MGQMIDISRHFDIDDIFYDDEIIEYVKGNMSPEDVFDEEILYTWAFDNGFTKDSK